MSANKKPLALVLGEGAYKQMIRKWGFNTEEDPQNNNGNFDLVVFTGGTDINASLYGEKKIPMSDIPDTKRDELEEKIYNSAVRDKIPMFGICRGAQFLCAMNGGKLIQHLDGHTQPHVARLNTGKLINVTSSHHQMMVPPNNGVEVLAVSNGILSNRYLNEKGSVSMSQEYEALYFSKTKSLAVQWHPEWAGADDPQQLVVKAWLNNIMRG